METIAYQKILFRTAMCVMACDGEIHESEVREMEFVFEQTNFFWKLTFKDEIETVISEFEQDEKQVVKECFDQIESGDLNPAQQLQVLEIVLRIMYADVRVDENEVRFLQIIKSLLDVPEEIFYKRFGKVSCLGGEHSTDKLIPTTNDYLKTLSLPDSQEIRKMLDDVEAVDNSDVD